MSDLQVQQNIAGRLILDKPKYSSANEALLMAKRFWSDVKSPLLSSNNCIKVWPSSQTVIMKTLRILVNTFSPDKMWRKLVLIPAKSYACMYVMFSLCSKQQSIFRVYKD